MCTATAIIGALVVFAVSAAATSLALRFLKSRQILDQPNERSSHTRATPRGLGIGFFQFCSSLGLQLFEFCLRLRPNCGGSVSAQPFLR